MEIESLIPIAEICLEYIWDLCRVFARVSHVAVQPLCLAADLG